MYNEKGETAQNSLGFGSGTDSLIGPVYPFLFPSINVCGMIKSSITMDLEEARACDDAAFRETDRQTVFVGEESKKEQK